MNEIVMSLIGLVITGLGGVIAAYIKTKIDINKLGIEDKMIDSAIHYAEDVAKQAVKNELSKVDKLQAADQFLVNNGIKVSTEKIQSRVNNLSVLDV